MHRSPAAQPLHAAFNCKERGGGPLYFLPRAYNTLSPPLFIRLGKRKRPIGSEKGVGIEKPEKYLLRL